MKKFLIVLFSCLSLTLIVSLGVYFYKTSNVEAENQIVGEKIEVSFVIFGDVGYADFNSDSSSISFDKSNQIYTKTYKIKVDKGSIVKVPFVYNESSTGATSFLGWYLEKSPNFQTEKAVSIKQTFDTLVEESSTFYAVFGYNDMSEKEQIYLTLNCPAYPFSNFNGNIRLDFKQVYHNESYVNSQYINGNLKIIPINKFADIDLSFISSLEDYSYKLIVNDEEYSLNFGEKLTIRFEENSMIYFELVEGTV